MSSVTPEPPAAIKKYHQKNVTPRLDLELNSRVQIRLGSINGNALLPGEFIGTVHYEFLIIRLPSVPGLMKKLIPHTLVDVRYQFEGADSSFVSEIINYTVKPSLLLFVTYPDRMSIQESRRHERLLCLLPARLDTPHGEAIGIMKDLSMGGCRIGLDLVGQSNIRKVKDGDNVVLNCTFANITEPVGGVSLVRNVEASGARLNIGMSFDKADKSNKEFLNSLAHYLDLIKKNA